MTINSTAVSSGPYTATGQTTFAVTFQSAGIGEIEVLLNGAVVNSAQYVHTRNPDGTGSVVFTSPQTGTIQINSLPSFLQPNQFDRYGAFYPDQINSGLDRLGASALYLKDRTNRSLRLPVGETALSLPAAATRALGVLGFDGVGVPVVYPPGAFAGSPGGVGPAGANSGTGANASTRTAMAAIASPTAGAPVILTEAGREGTFVWTTGNFSTLVTADTRQGIYVAPASDTTGASGAWVRKQTGNAIELHWFGITADNATDIFPAVACAFAVIGALAPVGYLSPLDFRGGPPLHIRYGVYYCSSSWDPLFTGRIYGDGGLGWGAATRINFPTGVAAVRIQSWFTSGDTGYSTASEHFTGDYLVIEHISFLGPNRNGTGRSVESSTAHGIHVKRPIVLRYCTFDGFEGDGFYAAGDRAGEGIVDECVIENCHFWNNRNGAVLRNNDSNGHSFKSCKFNFNRAWGVDDDAGLGNFYHDCNFDSNGITDFSKALGASVVTNGSNRYCLVDDQIVGAATNAPPAGATDNQWWYYMGPGGTLGTGGINIPTWTANMPLRYGGAFRLHGASATNLAESCYVESGQGFPQVQSPSMVIGCNTTVKGTGGFIQQVQGNLHMTNPYMRGSMYNEQQANSSFTFSGVENVVTPTMIFKTGTTNGAIEYRKSDNTKYGEIIASTTNGLYIDNALGINLRYNGSTNATVTASGFDISLGKVLTVNNTQVVSARQTGTAANATDLATALTLVNDLKAKLIAHGLIS